MMRAVQQCLPIGGRVCAVRFCVATRIKNAIEGKCGVNMSSFFFRRLNRYQNRALHQRILVSDAWGFHHNKSTAFWSVCSPWFYRLASGKQTTNACMMFNSVEKNRLDWKSFGPQKCVNTAKLHDKTQVNLLNLEIEDYPRWRYWFVVVKIPSRQRLGIRNLW